MSIYDTVQLDVEVDYSDVIEAHDEALRKGRDPETLTVVGGVVIGDALEEATIEQLAEALGRETPGYTDEQLDAIREAFAAAVRGDTATALDMARRVFEHHAQLVAVERGLRCTGPLRRAA